MKERCLACPRNVTRTGSRAGNGQTPTRTQCPSLPPRKIAADAPGASVSFSRSPQSGSSPFPRICLVAGWNRKRFFAAPDAESCGLRTWIRNQDGRTSVTTEMRRRDNAVVAPDRSTDSNGLIAAGCWAGIRKTNGCPVTVIGIWKVEGRARTHLIPAAHRRNERGACRAAADKEERAHSASDRARPIVLRSARSHENGPSRLWLRDRGIVNRSRKQDSRIAGGRPKTKCRVDRRRPPLHHMLQLSPLE